MEHKQLNPSELLQLHLEYLQKGPEMFWIWRGRERSSVFGPERYYWKIGRQGAHFPRSCPGLDSELFESFDAVKNYLRDLGFEVGKNPLIKRNWTNIYKKLTLV